MIQSMLQRLSLFVLLWLIGGAAPAADPVERLFWDRVPLRITLPVGKERLVTFPVGVRVGIPANLASKLRTQINQDTVYWLAKEAFDSQRIEVQEIDGQRIYLIDLAASRKTGLSEARIEVIVKRDAGAASKATGASTQHPDRAPGYIALTRFAAQQLYAPRRLLKAIPGVHRVSLAGKPLRNLLRGSDILATPLASWQSGHLTVTAVELVNTGDEFIELDPRNLRGAWRAATFQHNRLHPGGSEADTTAVYLISERPFQEAIR